ncbi:MAG TPA: excinuclease ABC subunit UvrC [Candidatus Kapabacteria bacterium]|nr:excinuclease ABC subunit UvrC [Candidatus Kapabacteria bacterium]
MDTPQIIPYSSEQLQLSKDLNPNIENKLAQLPTKPGVYMFKDSSNRIIYVGKAKNLRNRVRSYFQEGRLVDAKTRAMVSHIYDLEYIIVDTEDEAFILEDTLIKRHKPKYNILLRDDKTYPYIRITNEEFPRIFSTRRVVRDGSKYFGPYSDVSTMKALLRFIRNIFFVRSCQLNLTEESIAKNKFRLCLDYHIHKCEGPCVGYVSKEQYSNNIKKAIQILNGRTKDLEKQMQDEMDSLSEQMKYEEAAAVRDRLNKLHDFANKQKIVSSDLIDRDVFGLFRSNEFACSVVFIVREGKLIGRKHFIIKDAQNSENSEILQRTLESWYLERDFLPKEIFLPTEPLDLEYLTDWLSKRFNHSLTISIPQSGEKAKLVQMANSNAEQILIEYLNAIEMREKIIPRAVQSLQRDLRLKRPPMHIECFDNSHIQGTDLVSSMVVFEGGKPKKSEYRKFKNETVLRNDDFAAMKEAVRRRYTRVMNENKQLPDLIVIDGGKGQLNIAYEVLEELQIADKVPIIGLAKRLEEIFIPGQSESIQLPKSSSSLILLQHIRDEAHRFAITYHRKLRGKRTLQTELMAIPGIGKKRAEQLLQHFGSVKRVYDATKEELREVVNEKTAEAIWEYFHKENERVKE